VKASEQINRFMMMAGKHDAVAKKYGVSGYPTFIFIGPDGKKVGDASRDAGALIKQIGDVAAKYNRAPRWAESEETAVARAKEEQKPLLIVYRDDKPKSEQAVGEFSAQALVEFYDKAVWVQKTIDVKSDEAKALGITSVPALWILDPRIDDAKAQVLKKLGLPKGGAAIKTELASVLKTWKKAEAEAAPAEEPKKE
jgi:predicted DsbA family dithiol-disulfide isomerase